MRLRFTLVLIFSFLYLAGSAQKLSGQWTGGFISSGDPWGGGTEYVLELEVKDSKVQGFSYTYFVYPGSKRYYVICRLSGTYDKGSKSVVVTEVEKVKSNTPPDFRDCLQTHMLTYMKQGSQESLQGKWKPARTQDKCGTGETNLTRRTLAKMTPTQPEETISQKNSTTRTAPGTTQPSTGKSSPKSTPAKSAPGSAPSRSQDNATAKSASPQGGKTGAPSTAKQSPPKTLGNPQVGGTKEKTATVKTTKPPPPPAKPKDIEKPVTIDKPAAKTVQPVAPGVISATGLGKLEKRTKQVIKLIEVPEQSFTVKLYDNGQIDGDTVSLFFNGKLMVSSQRLSTNPITLEIKLDPGREDNDLVMYAENLGTIPPNTALMVVTVGDKRYEVNITSTEQTSGSVRFKLKE
jgi:hypothetical protein